MIPTPYLLVPGGAPDPLAVGAAQVIRDLRLGRAAGQSRMKGAAPTRVRLASCVPGAAEPVCPALGVTTGKQAVTEADALVRLAGTRALTGLPATDPFRLGTGRPVDAMRPATRRSHRPGWRIVR